VNRLTPVHLENSRWTEVIVGISFLTCELIFYEEISEAVRQAVVVMLAVIVAVHWLFARCIIVTVEHV